MERTDRDLMQSLASGETEALAPLMARHHARIYRIALSYLRRSDEALDCVQETFVKVFQRAHLWDGSAEPGAWLTRIGINEAIDRYRRSKRRREDPIESLPHTPHKEPGAEDSVRAREISEGLLRALDTLPERQRKVFVLRHYDEMSLEDIAGTLGLRLGTVKSSLHRALARLRVELKELHA